MTNTAPQTTLSEIEGLEVLFGPKPLLSFQNRFPTREALLRYYAAGVAQHFSPESADAAQCEICARTDTPGAFVTNVWTARTRWRILPILLIILLIPILAALAFLHLLSLIKPLLGGLQVSDKVTFQTVHSVCVACRKKLNRRAFLNGILLFVTGFVGVVSGIAAILMGSFLFVSLMSWCNMRPRDAADMLLPFILSLLLSAGAIIATRIFSLRIRLPSQLRTIVKKPFRLTNCYIQIPPTTPITDISSKI